MPFWLVGEVASDPGFPWDLVGGIVLFVAMLMGAYFLIRLLSGRGFARQGRFFRVLDRFPISRDCSILLLAVGSRVLAVCVGKEGGNLLCELDPEELDAARGGEPSGGSSSAGGMSAPAKREVSGQEPSFGQRFVHNMKLNMGFLPKNTPPMTPVKRSATVTAKGDADFAALLHTLQQSGAAQDAAPQVDDGAQQRAADYGAAVENMRRLAQTEAPAVRPASTPVPSAGPSPAPAGRAQSADEETARELLRMLQDRKKPHETPKPENTNSAGSAPAPEERMDELLDKIAQRQSRYSSPGKKAGGHNRKDRS